MVEKPRQKLEVAVSAFLEALGHPTDSNAELQGTPARVAEAWENDLLVGYRMDPRTILAERCTTASNAVVTLRHLRAVVVCPHHLLPAAGVAHIGYLPGESCVGFGALGRLVDCFGRRLALQEDVATQIADALVEELGAQGAICTLDLTPSCMVVRGERQNLSRAIVTSESGTVTPELRAAFFQTSRP